MVLTRNEWIKAERLGEDYWLYVVYDARPVRAPRLVMIQDPAEVLAEKGRVEGREGLSAAGWRHRARGEGDS